MQEGPPAQPRGFKLIKSEGDIRPLAVWLGFFHHRASVPGALFSLAPPLSTMASTSKQSKRRDGIISTLDVFIQVLSIAKDTCAVPPAQIAFGSASVLLTMIRVHPSLLCEKNLSTHACLGHDGQRPGLPRPWTSVRRCMSSTRPEIEGETCRWTHPSRARCDWGSDWVNKIDNKGRQVIHLLKSSS